MKVHNVYTDGGAYNNGRPNQLARICVVHENEVMVHESIGNHTSNEAEFMAIERAFEWINENIKDDVVVVFSDSKLAVNMINYIWQGRLERLKEIRDRVANKLPKNVVVKWVYRDYNRAGQFLEFNLPREK